MVVRNLPQVNASVIRAAKTTPIIRDEIRPLVRTARKPVRDLQPASKRLASGRDGATGGPDAHGPQQHA